jgi:glycosyltransferase involved in cell wall biosynthesis
MACVARLFPPAKGQDILIGALAGSAWRSRCWRLTFYGDGPMRQGIERLIRDANLSDRVEIAGYSESVESIWAKNHVLVMPSRYEGLPLALVEAMLCARPAVASDAAGNSEVLRDGFSGFIADAPTVKSFELALERLWENRARLRAMGENAAKRIREQVPAEPGRVFAERLKALAIA